MKYFGLSWILIFILCGCASQDRTQVSCTSGGWFQAGYKDGFAGDLHQSLEQLIKACEKKVDIDVKSKSYEAGWEKGASLYCKPGYQQGFKDAESKRAFKNILSRKAFCVENGLKLNIARYKRGFQEGQSQ